LINVKPRRGVSQAARGGGGPLLGKAGDASVDGGEGKTLIHFDREAQSLDDALRSAMANVQGQGWQVREIAVEPDCMLPVARG